MKILLKRNSTVGYRPTVEEIQLGEIAINTSDGKLYTKLSDGVLEWIHHLNITPSGLETVDDGNGIGYRLVGMNSTFYAPTSEGAITLSLSDEVASPEKGASGRYSVTMGEYTLCQAPRSLAGGYSARVYADPDPNVLEWVKGSSLAWGIHSEVYKDNGFAFAGGKAMESHTFSFGWGSAGAQGAVAFNSFSNGPDSFSAAGGTTLGKSSVALAYGIANGDNSFATNFSATANGENSFAANNGTADGPYSASFGGTAVGHYSASFGYGTSIGDYSASFGNNTKAIGYGSHAEGGTNNSSHFTEARGYYSHAEGWGTIAQGKAAHAEGFWNIGKQDTIHETGIGDYDVQSATPTRKNAFEIYTDGRIHAPEQTIALHDNPRSLATKEYVDANSGGGGGGSSTGLEAIPAQGEYGDTSNGWRLIGKDPAAYVDIGMNAVDFTTSYATVGDSGAEGYYTFASGYRTRAAGSGSAVFGEYCIATGKSSFAAGSYNNSAGAYSTAFGRTHEIHSGTKDIIIDIDTTNKTITLQVGDPNWNNTWYKYITIEVTTQQGNKDYVVTRADIFNTSTKKLSIPDLDNLSDVAIGDRVWSNQGEGSGFTCGNSNKILASRGGFAEGLGCIVEGNYSHAEGYQTTASGDNSHAEGYQTTASGDNSHAEGYYTTAQNDNMHSAGKYNVGTATDTIHETGIGFMSSGGSIKKNAFEIYTDGTLTAPEATPALVQSRGNQTLVPISYLLSAEFGNSLPTSPGITGQIYNNGGVLTISP